MKLKDFVNPNKNTTNKQVSLTLKKKLLKKKGLTEEDILNMEINLG